MNLEPDHSRDAALPEGWLQVDSIDLEAQGIARRPDGKVVFIDGALAGELVSVSVHRRKNQWEAATLTELHRASSLRVRPRCPHFGLHQGACGGCKMQHLDASAQVAVKQRALEDQLWHLGKVRPALILRPIEGPAWGYRWRARLSVRYVAKRGEVLVGFHERKSRYVADMRECPVLPAHVSALLLPLRALIHGMQARDSCPQIELACGDEVTALVLRHLEPLSAADRQRLSEFGRQHGVQWWLQAKGPDSVHPLDGQAPALSPIEDPTAAKGYKPVQMPMPAVEHASYAPNSLWRTGSRAFFKDQRARNIGDLVTVKVKFTDRAQLENTTKRSRKNGEDFGAARIMGFENKLDKFLPDGSSAGELLKLDSEGSSEGSGSVRRAEQLATNVAAVVTQKLPNGNLVIEGKQEIRVNFEVRELIVAGVIRPEDIESDNTIESTKIAQARIAYGGRGQITDVQQPRYGQQVMDILLPF